MSHLSVLVVGDDVDGQLAPFHQFECTGDNNQYVQTIDETEEARKEYESGTSRRLRDPEGVLHDPYDDRFYREPTAEELRDIGPIASTGGNSRMSWSSKDWKDGKGYRAKIHQVPDGWEDVWVPRPQLETFADWAADWYGRAVLEEGDAPDLDGAHKYGWIAVRPGPPPEVVGVFDRTNPNRQWDWWVIGGRWSGFFLLKEGVGRDAAERAAGSGDDPRRVNQARKGEIDFEGMRAAAAEEARERWRVAAAAIAGRPVPVWREMMDALGEKPTAGQIDALREEYRDNPVIRDLRTAGFYSDVEEYAVSEDQYVSQARDRAIRTFAAVKDSVWYEKGSMGWWGVVSDEKDEKEWGRQFNELIAGLPDDTLLTVVDCHI